MSGTSIRKLAPPAAPITQAHIDDLLVRIQQTRLSIQAERQALIPLEANLQKASDAYQEAVGALHRRVIYLSAEISDWRLRIEQQEWEAEEMGEAFSQSPFEHDGGHLPPEAIAKSVLLEHAVRVLDHLLSEEDAELLADIQHLCHSVTSFFADVLEQIPWGKFWIARSPRETVAQQYARLSKWAAVLEGQLTSLQKKDEQLRRDPRYGLWRRWQAGPNAWQQFIAQTREQYLQQIFELESELNEMREAEEAR